MSELLTYLQTNDPQFRKARLGALYSDFRPLQTTNPDGYTANINAWLSGLSSASLAGAISSSSQTHQHDLLTLSINQKLLSELETREWGRPLALGTVVREGIQRGDFVAAGEFNSGEYKSRPKGGRGWGINLSPLAVLSWGARTLGILGEGEDMLPEGKVVILSNLQLAAKEFSKRLQAVPRSRTERVFSRKTFREEFGDVLGRGRYLGRDKGLLACDGETVKVRGQGEKSVGAVTREDETIASLKSLIKDLEIQTVALEKKVDELSNTARTAVEKKNRTSALAALKSKKIAETSLSKRHDTLAQLEQVFASIEQAADQVELVRVMEASTKVLSGLNKEVGGVERVDNVVEQLREQMGMVGEVGDVIAEVGRNAVVVDDGEVDDELEAMEKAEREKIEEKERVIREAREKREAEETKKRLDDLEAVEKEAKEKASKEAEKEGVTEQDLDDSTEILKRMSLDPTTALETA
ncbi:Snf7-domain-containing protein [Halenospora varia]|nr:Snf7-domain-containing protein [Halenospora varia]